MAYHYYYCDVNSAVGSRVRRFWHRAKKAAEAADAYARKYGAVSYVQPVQYFEGGVEYLEFDKTPEEGVWRKKLETDGRVQYEPDCHWRTECLVVPDSRLHPADTWNKTFSKQSIEWKNAQKLFPLEYWAKAVNIQLSDDKEADRAVIDLELRNRTFILFREFYSDHEDTSNGKASQPLRRAIRAEKDRLSLPIVQVESLYAALEMQQPETADDRKAYNESGTPLFFFYRQGVYLRVCLPCKAQGLHEITGNRFYDKSAELKAEQRLKEESD